MNDGLNVPFMERAKTAPLPSDEKKQHENKSLDPSLPIPGMTRITTSPIPGNRKTNNGRNIQPRSFHLFMYNSEDSIDVKVPSRDIMSRMTFFDAPISSIYGPQLTKKKLGNLRSKITDMGFSGDQALAGLILTDGIGINDAVNLILSLPPVPVKHDFVDRKSAKGASIQGKHELLSLQPESVGNRWPWNVEEEKLCSQCGLPRQLFHKGDYNLNDTLSSVQEETLQAQAYYEEFPEEKKSNTVENKTDEVSVFIKIDDPVSEQPEKEEDIPEVITCGICFMELSQDKIFLAPCRHYYCKECLGYHYTEKIKNGDVLRLPCPYMDSNNIPCEREVEAEEILSLIDDDMKVKFKKFTAERLIQLNENARHCPRPGCEGYVIGSWWKPKLNCPECNHVFCWKCTNDWHGYFSRCIQHHDGAFLAFTLGKDIQKCPRCRVRIWKSDGCNHMTCNLCHYQFCWLCRGEYSSNHFDSWNLMGCPGGMYFDSVRCPGCCPSYVNRLMLWICAFGVLLPLAIACASTLLALFLTAVGIWLSIWIVICIPCSMRNSEYMTPAGCRDECCD